VDRVPHRVASTDADDTFADQDDQAINKSQYTYQTAHAAIAATETGTCQGV